MVEETRERRDSHFVDIRPMAGEPLVTSQKSNLWYWVTGIVIGTALVSGLIIFFLPKNPLRGMTKRDIDLALNKTMQGAKAQLLSTKSVSGDDVVRLEEEMKKWQDNGLLPHEIIQNNLGMNHSGAKAQNRVHYLLDEAKISLLKQDLRLDALMMQALVKSATPLNVGEFIECLDKFFREMHKDISNYARECPGGKFTANTLIQYVEKNNRGLQVIVDKQEGLDRVPELCKIIEAQWGDISQKSKKPLAPSRFKQDPLALIAENKKCDKTFKAMCQGYVKTIGIGASIPTAFKHFMQESEGFRLSINGYKEAPVKGIPRVIQKFFYKYGQDATKIVDIVRCSFVFDTVKQLYCGLDMAIRHFVAANKKKNPKLTVTDCVWIKDRFKNPVANGYRDIILMTRVPGTQLWAEAQFHLKQVISYKDTHMHKCYEIMRHFPNSGEIESAIAGFMTTAKSRGCGFDRFRQVGEQVRLTLHDKHS